jgi:hypothetical protein
MDRSLRVLWTIISQGTPRALRYCSHCGSEQRFRSSDRFRLNANGRRIDAWLIYKCMACDDTWNRPLLERRNLADVAPALLEELRQNDPALAQRVAFDTGDLRRIGVAVEKAGDATVRKNLVSQSTGTMHYLDIRLAVPYAIALRLDRLLARELALSRTRLYALRADRRLELMPDGPRALKRAVCDGTRVILYLSREADAAALAAAACSD